MANASTTTKAQTNDTQTVAQPTASIKPTPARRSKLLAVSPESVEPKHPKILIYGPAGVGKTWTALEFPNVFYVDTEGGADLDHYRAKLKASGGGYFGPDQGSLDFETVIGQVEALATERHNYKTIVFDSVTKLFAAAISGESERLGDKDVFGASKKTPVRQMARLVNWVNRADLNGIYICHEQALWGMKNGQREEIGRTFDAWPKLEYELHLALRIGKLGGGEGAKRVAYIGKSRLPAFPEGGSFDWSYASFAERYGRDVIEKEAVPVVLATSAQITEVSTLLERVKVPDDWQVKCFKKADIDSWAEMETGMIDKCLVFLRERAVVPGSVTAAQAAETQTEARTDTAA